MDVDAGLGEIPDVKAVSTAVIDVIGVKEIVDPATNGEVGDALLGLLALGF